jgi:hypothetical protein
VPKGRTTFISSSSRTLEFVLLSDLLSIGHTGKDRMVSQAGAPLRRETGARNREERVRRVDIRLYMTDSTLLISRAVTTKTRNDGDMTDYTFKHTSRALATPETKRASHAPRQPLPEEASG